MQRRRRDAERPCRQGDAFGIAHGDERANLTGRDPPVQFAGGGIADRVRNAAAETPAKFDMPERHAHAGYDDFAEFGRKGSGTAPFEQRHAEMNFELLDRLGNGGLRKVDGFRSLVGAVRPRDLLQDAQVFQIGEIVTYRQSPLLGPFRPRSITLRPPAPGATRHAPACRKTAYQAPNSMPLGNGTSSTFWKTR